MFYMQSRVVELGSRKASFTTALLLEKKQKWNYKIDL
jgi:hypothetical protein